MMTNELLTLLQETSWRSSATRERLRSRSVIDLPGQATRLQASPVTNEEFVEVLNYCAIVNLTGGTYEFLNTVNTNLPVREAGGSLSIRPGFEDHPAVGVNWYGAALFAALVGGRLPSLAEYQEACGPGRFPWGNQPPSADLCNYDFLVGVTTPTLRYAPNPNGFYDLAGNVREWCVDPYEGPLPDAGEQWAATNRQSGSYVPFRSVFGGAWNKGAEYLACHTVRGKWPRQGSDSCGFRVAFDRRTK